MQRDKKIEEIKKIIKRLEELNCELNSNAIKKAIENLKIAIYGKKVGSEGFEHSYIREKLFELFSGNIYVESANTGFSKIGFRPDLLIVNDKELIIVEIETNKKRAKNKMSKICKNLEKIKAFPLSINRKVRIVFCLTFYDDEFLKEAKEKNFEVYILKGKELLPV